MPSILSDVIAGLRSDDVELPTDRFKDNAAQAAALRAHAQLKALAPGTSGPEQDRAQFSLLYSRARKARGLPEIPEDAIHARLGAVSEKKPGVLGGLSRAIQAGATGAALPFIPSDMQAAAAGRASMQSEEASEAAPIAAPVVQSLTQAAPLLGAGRLLSPILAPRVVIAGVAAGAGQQVYSSELQALIAQGIDPAKAHEEALQKAIVTGAVTLAGGATGVERLAVPGARLGTSLPRILGRGALEAGSEGAEEVVEEVGHIATERGQGRAPSGSEARGRIVDSALLGSLAGGVANAPSTISDVLARPGLNEVEALRDMQAEADAQGVPQPAPTRPGSRIEQERAAIIAKRDAQRAAVVAAQTKAAEEAKAKADAAAATAAATAAANAATAAANAATAAAQQVTQPAAAPVPVPAPAGKKPAKGKKAAAPAPTAAVAPAPAPAPNPVDAFLNAASFKVEDAAAQSTQLTQATLRLQAATTARTDALTAFAQAETPENKARYDAAAAEQAAAKQAIDELTAAAPAPAPAALSTSSITAPTKSAAPEPAPAPAAEAGLARAVATATSRANDATRAADAAVAETKPAAPAPVSTTVAVATEEAEVKDITRQAKLSDAEVHGFAAQGQSQPSTRALNILGALKRLARRPRQAAVARPDTSGIVPAGPAPVVTEAPVRAPLNQVARARLAKDIDEAERKVTNIERNKMGGPKVMKFLTEATELRDTALADPASQPMVEKINGVVRRIKATLPDLADTIATPDTPVEDTTTDPDELAAVSVVESELDKHGIPRLRETKNGPRDLLWGERLAQLAAVYETKLSTDEGRAEVKAAFDAIEDARLELAKQDITSPEAITELTVELDARLQQSAAQAISFVQDVLSTHAGALQAAQELNAQTEKLADGVTPETVRANVVQDARMRVAGRGTKLVPVRIYSAPTAIGPIVDEYTQLYATLGGKAQRLIDYRKAQEQDKQLQARLDNLNRNKEANRSERKKAIEARLEARATMAKTEGAKNVPLGPKLTRLIELGYVLRVQQLRGLESALETVGENRNPNERRAILRQYVSEMVRVVNGIHTLDTLSSATELPDPTGLKGWNAPVLVAETIVDGKPSGQFTVVRRRSTGKTGSGKGYFEPVNSDGVSITKTMFTDAKRVQEDDVRLGRVQGNRSALVKATVDRATPFTTTDPADIVHMIGDLALYIPQANSVRLELQNALSGTVPTGRMTEAERIGYGVAPRPPFRGGAVRTEIDGDVVYAYPDLWIEGSDVPSDEGASPETRLSNADQWMMRHLLNEVNEAKFHPNKPGRYGSDTIPVVHSAPIAAVHDILRTKFGITDPAAYMAEFKAVRAISTGQNRRGEDVYRTSSMAAKFRQRRRNQQSLLTSLTFAGPNPAATPMSVDNATRQIGDLFGIPLSIGVTEKVALPEDTTGTYDVTTGDVALSEADVLSMLHEAGHKAWNLGVARVITQEETDQLILYAIDKNLSAHTDEEGFAEFMARVGEASKDPAALQALITQWPHAWTALDTGLSGPFAEARNAALGIAKAYYSQPDLQRGTGFVSTETAKASENKRLNVSAFIDRPGVLGWVAGTVTRMGRAIFDPNAGILQLVKALLAPHNLSRADIAPENDPLFAADEARNFAPRAHAAIMHGFEVGGRGGQVRGALHDVIEALNRHGFTEGAGQQAFFSMAKMLNDLDASPRLRRKLGINDGGPFAWTTSVQEIQDPFHTTEELREHNAKAAAHNASPAGAAAPMTIYDPKSYGRQDALPLSDENVVKTKAVFDKMLADPEGTDAFTVAYDYWQEHLAAFDAWRHDMGDLTDAEYESRGKTVHYLPISRYTSGTKVDASLVQSTTDVINSLEAEADAITRAFARTGYNHKRETMVSLWLDRFTFDRAAAARAAEGKGPGPTLDPRLAKMITPQSFRLLDDVKDAKSLEAYERGDQETGKSVEIQQLRLSDHMARQMVGAEIYDHLRKPGESDDALAERLTGRVIEFRVTDPILREWMHRSLPSAGDLGAIVRGAGHILRLNADVVRKMMTTYNPEYWAKQTVWDLFTVIPTDPSRSLSKFVMAPARMFGAMGKLLAAAKDPSRYKTDPVLSRAVAAGMIPVPSIGSFTEPMASSEVEALKGWSRALNAKGWRHVLGSAHEIFMRFPMAIMSAPRVAAFENSLRLTLKEHGVHSTKDLHKLPQDVVNSALARAGAVAHESTMNSLRMAKAIEAANPYIPFLNSSIQGSMTIGKALLGWSPHDRKADPVRAAINIMGTIIAPVVAQFLLYKDDEEALEEYQSRPLSERLRYTVIPGEDGKMLRVPKIPGFVGAAQMYLFDTLAMSMKGDPDQRATVWQHVTEVGASVLPMMPDYLFALYHTVVPEDRASPRYSATVAALPVSDRPPLMRGLGAIGVPDGALNRIDAAIDAYTGGTMRWFMDNLPLTDGNIDPKTSRDGWRGVPIIRLLNSADPGLYDTLGKRFQAYTDIDMDANLQRINAAEQNGSLSAEAAAKARTSTVMLGGILEREKIDLSKRFSLVARQLQALDRDTSLTEQQHRERMDRIVDIMHTDIAAWLDRVDALTAKGKP